MYLKVGQHNLVYIFIKINLNVYHVGRTDTT